MPTDANFMCIDGIVPVRSEPDPQSERITDLLFGEEFTPKSEHEGAVFGATGADGVEGFVPRASLVSKSGHATHRVRRTFIHIYHAPDLMMAAGKILPMNALVEITGRSAAVRYPGGGPGSTVVELRSGGWVTEQGLSPIDHFETDLRSVAAMFIGAVYLHGGKTWLGCDGSGFIQTVLAACGLKIPRRLPEQLEFFGEQGLTTGVGHTTPSVVYRGESCGFGFENGEVIVASPQEMQVISASQDQFFQGEPNMGPHIFAIPESRKLSHA